MSPPKDPIKKEEWIKIISKKAKLRIGPKNSFYGNHHTEEAKQINRNAHLGKNLSEKTKKKIGEAQTGEKNHFYGKKHSEEFKQKQRMRYIGKPLAEEHKRKIRINTQLFFDTHPIVKENMSISRRRENNPNWQGGKSFEPYTIDFNDRFKELIRKRDNYMCQLCTLFEEDAKKLYNKNLIVHHIDYNKLNSFFQNCISLCSKCSSIVNFNRPHWTKFFQSLLVERYGYQYTYDQKIVLDFNKPIEISTS